MGSLQLEFFVVKILAVWPKQNLSQFVYLTFYIAVILSQNFGPLLRSLVGCCHRFIQFRG